MHKYAFFSIFSLFKTLLCRKEKEQKRLGLSHSDECLLPWLHQNYLPIETMISVEYKQLTYVLFID